MGDRKIILNQDDIEHLKYLQDIIKRMADNSFKIKGWSITITGGLLALLISNPKASTKDLLVVLVPIIGFWLIDTYYLRLERIFRNRYESDVLKIKNKSYSDIRYFSFGKQHQRKKISEIIKNINIEEIINNFLDYISIFISISMILTYLSMCFSVLFLMHVLG